MAMDKPGDTTQQLVQEATEVSVDIASVLNENPC